MPVQRFNPGVSIRAPSLNPNQGFSLAASAFGDINEQFAREEAAAAANVIREQQLALDERQVAFQEGGPARAIAEEQRKAALSAEKAQTAIGIGKGLAFGGEQEFFDRPEVQSALDRDPTYQSLSDQEKNDYRSQFLAENRGIYQDPDTYGQQVRETLAATGQYSLDEINKISNEQVGQLFGSGADAGVISKLLAKPGSTVAGGAGGTGTLKHEFDTTDPTYRSKSIDRYITNFDLDAEPSLTERAIRAAGGDVTPTALDYENLSGVLARNGITSGTAFEASMGISRGQDGDLKESYNWYTKKGEKAIVEYARGVEAEETKKFGSKGGVPGAGATAQDVRDYNSQLLSTLSPSGATQEQILTSFLGGLGYDYGKPVTRNDGGVETTTVEPVDQKAPAVRAPSTGAGKKAREEVDAPILSQPTKRERRGRGGPTAVPPEDQSGFLLDTLTSGEPLFGDVAQSTQRTNTRFRN